MALPFCSYSDLSLDLDHKVGFNGQAWLKEDVNLVPMYNGNPREGELVLLAS